MWQYESDVTTLFLSLLFFSSINRRWTSAGQTTNPGSPPCSSGAASIQPSWPTKTSHKTQWNLRWLTCQEPSYSANKTARKSPFPSSIWLCLNWNLYYIAVYFLCIPLCFFSIFFSLTCSQNKRRSWVISIEPWKNTKKEQWEGGHRRGLINWLQ